MVMSPLTRSRAGKGDTATALIAEYYRQRATAGLIITESSQISAQAKGYPRTPGIFNNDQVEGWKLVTDAVHAEGGQIFLQIWHTGRLSHRTVQPSGALPVAPSAIKAEGDIFTPEGLKALETPRALDILEIPGIVEDFRRAAANAKLAGFDGVEIHAANGYLIDQFLRDGTNIRTDSYGGSLENRARLLKEVVEAVIPIFGADRTGVRLSPIFDGFSMRDSDPRGTFGYVADLLFGGTYIANGGYSAERAAQAIRSGNADLVSFGTAFLANPDLVKRFKHGARLNEADKATFYQGEGRGYIDYPYLEELKSKS